MLQGCQSLAPQTAEPPVAEAGKGIGGNVTGGYGAKKGKEVGEFLYRERSK